MWVLNRIAEYFWDLYSFFNNVAWECWSSFYIPDAIGDFMWGIARGCMDISDRFISFSLAMSAILQQLGEILIWSNIRSLILGWLPDLEGALSWWQDWWSWVRQEIYSWWSSAQYTVQGWIDITVSGVEGLVGQLEAHLAGLQGSWDTFKGKIPPIDEVIAWFSNWWGSVLAGIIAWGALTATQIDELISSRLKSYDPFWAGWQDWRDQVAEFFSDPAEFVWDRFTDWFLGPEA